MFGFQISAEWLNRTSTSDYNNNIVYLIMKCFSYLCKYVTSGYDLIATLVSSS